MRARSWPFGFQSSIWKPSHRSRLFISFSLAIGFHEFYLVSCRIFLMHSKVVLLVNSGKSFALLLVSFGGFPSSFFLFFECLGFPWSMLEFAIRIFARFLVLILCISLRGRWLFQDTIMFWTLAQSCPLICDGEGSGAQSFPLIGHAFHVPCMFVLHMFPYVSCTDCTPLFYR